MTILLSLALASFLLVMAIQNDRRMKPVRLTEVPLVTRINAARKAAKAEQDDQERMAILAAALHPSNTVYWIAA